MFGDFLGIVAGKYENGQIYGRLGRKKMMENKGNINHKKVRMRTVHAAVQI